MFDVAAAVDVVVVAAVTLVEWVLASLAAFDLLARDAFACFDIFLAAAAD